MSANTLDDLFYDGLKDIYYAERKILEGAAQDGARRGPEALRRRSRSTWNRRPGHVERLHQVFDFLGKRAAGKTCPAIDGILEEGEEIIEELKGAPALDAGLVARHRPSSTTRSLATARCGAGPRRWA